CASIYDGYYEGFFYYFDYW
nr:immunoglobulin heavy chain junction region [Mus musculus]